MKWRLIASSIKGGIGLKIMMTPKDYSSAVCSYGKLPDIHYIYDTL
jgi:hypothetical protein